MKSRTLSRLFRPKLLLASCLLLGACKREDSKVDITQIERCERGIERAVLQPEVRDALKTYYSECAGVYAEPACKQAFSAAAQLEPAQQMPKVVQGCRTAYCPMFQDRGYEICQPGLQIKSDDISKLWPPLHDAILAREAKGYAPRLTRAMLVFYSRVLQRTGGVLPGSEPSPTAAAASDAGEGLTLDGSLPDGEAAGARASEAGSAAAAASADAAPGAQGSTGRKPAKGAP
jgi:hypothetical protein